MDYILPQCYDTIIDFNKSIAERKPVFPQEQAY